MNRVIKISLAIILSNTLFSECSTETKTESLTKENNSTTVKTKGIDVIHNINKNSSVVNSGKTEIIVR